MSSFTDIVQLQFVTNATDSLETLHTLHFSLYGIWTVILRNRNIRYGLQITLNTAITTCIYMTFLSVTFSIVLGHDWESNSIERKRKSFDCLSSFKLHKAYDITWNQLKTVEIVSRIIISFYHLFISNFFFLIYFCTDLIHKHKPH